MKTGKRLIAFVMTMLMVLSCWVWFEPVETVSAATITGDSNYLFAYFTGTSIEGQTIHLAVSQDGLNYTALRNNEPVIVPSKGTGCVRDPYLWYNEQDKYYYILATDLDFTDTGSDYSDNSESFIVWRSKDLVNWYDETMIDVKAVLGRLGINNNNMQAVWAPQVLWDGSSYVVYFSLQCDATSNGSWNPLTIVYLKTTDLLDQSKYYEYGVIHNPGRHVIDADIIKKPNSNQYYMFYKDESASGGVQSIYYMVSDNGPTGPYYAPNNANDGRGPQLFASIGKNLEGCNSFFDDSNNLITFVDEYDYTNSAGQKEAHFHVSRTSDFTNYTTLADSSHNINSLSPRHGSVVKITDAEYNRLLEYSGEITSSSFPETENLEDHLVGRYFTTADYTYNAANGKNDLTLTDGTISVSTDTSGDYYAYFNAAGAEINLAQLISGDLNIKDGFSITFSASVPSSLGSNSRFFDISNNWSQRTDPAECYLHMSPVADNNGLYVGAYNGPVTTSSWVWASQGRNYNDNVMHDYIISFADGNMILYIDGKLAMKRDRYNMNAEYGDNFLTDSWYKTIGNSTMRIGKSEWSDPLFTGAIQNFCIYDCSLSYYDVQKMQNTFDEQAGKNTVSKIVVPETVYMTPSTGESKLSQYYVNNTMHNGTNEVNLENSVNGKGGVMEFYIPGAKHFIVEVNTKTSGIGDIILTEHGRNTDSYEKIQYDADANGYFSYETLGFRIDGTGLTAGKTALAEWKITVIMKDGSQTTHYAYTTLYAPWYLPVGAATRANASDGDLFDQSIAWVSGVHGYTANSSGSYWIAATNQTLNDEGEYNEKGTYYANTNMLPLISSIGTAGTTTAVKNWLSTSAPSGVPNPTIRYFSLNGKNSNYGCLVADISPVANITVDTSRYTNFKQIPNLTVGYNITDIESSKGVIWYVSDFTSIANSKQANSDGVKFYNYTKQDSSSNISNKAKGEWFDNGAEGSIIYGSATQNCGSTYNAVSTGVEYNSAWDRNIITGTNTYDYMFKGAAHAHRNSDRRTYSINFVQLRATNVDKTKLRNLVLKATYFNQSDYTTASWSTFQTALQNAAYALGNPTNSDIASVTTTLENAMNALQTTVTLNANGGTINGSSTISFNVTVGAETTVAYNLSDYIAKPSNDNYAFIGWSTNDKATTGSMAVTAGLMPTIYAVFVEKTYILSFDANGGNGSVENETVKISENFVIPSDEFTKEGYTLLGWSTDKNAKTPEYTPGQTVSKLSTTNNAKITLYAVWAEIINAVDDTVVIEYGLPVEINVLKNDAFATNVTAIGTSAPNTGSVKNTERAFEGTSLTLANGKVELKDGKITYTPTTTNTSNVDIFYYEVTVNGDYYYAKVTVIPATSMYYEDTLFTFTDAGNYKWSAVGEVFDAFQSDELDEAYGYDSAYDDNVAYSGGNVHYTTIDKNATAINTPTATFTFTGTGFDLFTVTDYYSGLVTATIYKVKEDGSSERVKGVMANAYFGYDYDAETNTYVPTNNGALYQIPIIKARGLDYGTYTVDIAPRYNKAFDVTDAGECTIYVDSVRIYDPMGGNSEIADEAYMADGEYAPEYLSMRDTIVQANADGTFGSLGTGTSVYLDGGNTTISDYIENGPKSEVYLGKGNSVAFHIVTKSNVVPSTIQLGMRLTGMNGSAADVKLTKGTSTQWVRNISLNSTTERFYNIESVVDWTVLDDGTYKTATPIIITNNSNAIVSLTSLKWAFDGTGAQTELYVMSDETTPRIAMFAIRRAVQTEAQDTILNPENIAFSFSEDAYTVGDSGILTVVTEQGVEAVTVNGEDAIFNCTDDNDKMLWTYEFSADAAGTMTFEIVAADENGFTSESVYATTEVNDVVIDITPETPDDNDDESEGLGGFMNSFKAISDFINKIIDMIKKMFTFMMGGITK